MQVCEMAANEVRGPGAETQSEPSFSSGGQWEAGLEGGIWDDLFQAALCHTGLPGLPWRASDNHKASLTNSTTNLMTAWLLKII